MVEKTDFSSFIQHLDEQTRGITIAVEGIHCAGCIGRIESSLSALPGIRSARLNVSTRRLTISWIEGKQTPDKVLSELQRLGFKGHPFQQRLVEAEDTSRAAFLLRCLGVAGFAAMNIMLLSVSVWSGYDGDISPETRDLFHWLSALIALPAAAYAGQPFFASAWKALRRRSMNMDVPISLGVILALAMSVVETAQHAEHAYFDSALMLLFFLLCGRYLDHLMRKRTRAVAATLAAMKGEVAHRFMADNEIVAVPASELKIADRILIRAGDRVPADVRVISGTASFDEALVTGETTSRIARTGDVVFAGSVNLDGALTAEVLASGSGTLIDEVERLLEKASTSKTAYVQLADRAAQLYAPVVHLTAALTLIGWLIYGHSAHDAIIAAIAVLIITCPCALALAIPVVQVVASGSLFRGGILLNSGNTLERMAIVDTIVFDKTGTLTLPEPRVANASEISNDMMQLAAQLAQSSRHPLAQAIARQASGLPLIEGAEEVPGQGVKATINGTTARLGSLEFCGIGLDVQCQGSEEFSRLDKDTYSLIAFCVGDRKAVFKISQVLRSDAKSVVSALKKHGIKLVILSGDRIHAVAPIAATLGIECWFGAQKPADKIAYIERLKASGHKVLMVGDGLNDAPALATANVSLSPITATDLTQAHADAVFLGEDLAPVLDILEMSRKAQGLMKQNLWLAVIYNAIAVPLAIAGYVTPLIAALAMSGSSILVTLNALRARGRSRPSSKTGSITTILPSATDGLIKI